MINCGLYRTAGGLSVEVRACGMWLCSGVAVRDCTIGVYSTEEKAEEIGRALAIDRFGVEGFTEEFELDDPRVVAP